MRFPHFIRPLAVACTLAATLSACNTGTKEGDTNVEQSAAKEGMAAQADGVPSGDSVTAGLARDTARKATGKDLYQAAGEAKDRNHDGLAD